MFIKPGNNGQMGYIYIHKLFSFNRVEGFLRVCILVLHVNTFLGAIFMSYFVAREVLHCNTLKTFGRI